MPGIVYTSESLRILALLQTGRKTHAYAISRQLEIPINTTYRILVRFSERGFLQASTEPVDRQLSGRTPRAIYQMTPFGHREVREIRRMLRRPRSL